ncbi:c-type cytochrome [bacterium]|nr:c-type cytochrome [bacterium]
MYRVFAGLSVILLIVFGIAIYDDYDREWKDFQKEFYRIALEKAEDDREKAFVRGRKVEIKQILVDGGGRVDRCTTCHLGVDDSRFSKAEEVFRTHPNPLQHPFPKFGCTICHGGEGRSTTAEEAHGHPEDWENPTERVPMLQTKYIQASCGKCHVDDSISGMPILALGRKLLDEKGCFNCHKVNGVGRRSIGPDLSREGVYGREAYRSPNWLFKHFKDPAFLVPDTEMPNFRLSDEEAGALTLLMLSFTGEEFSGYLGSRRIEEAKQVAINAYKASSKRPEPSSSGEGLYSDLRCSACHRIGEKGGIAGASLTDVGNRRIFLWLYEHFKSPKAVVPYSTMPDLRLSDEDAEELSEYMLDLKSGRERVIALATTKEAGAEQTLSPGEKVYDQKRCDICHSLKGQGVPVGPDLSNIGERRDAEWLLRHFKEGPRVVYPKSMMPKIAFSPEDAENLVQFLITLKE